MTDTPDSESVRQSAGEFTLPKPKPNIVIQAPDGRTVTMDFGGPLLEISGDLPLNEAARVFWEHVHIFRQEAIAERDARIAKLEQAPRDIIGVPVIARDVESDAMRIIAERALKETK